MDQIETDLFGKLTTDPATIRHYIDLFGALAVNLAAGLLILAVTFWLSGTLSRLIRKRFGQGKRRRRVDATLANFLASVVRYVIIIVGLIAVLQQLGVQITSILAVLGAASLAIGLAMQGALSNVAAGVMLLLLRPYRVNDLVEIGGRKGTVRSLDLFTTELVSPEGLKVVVPNGKVFGDMIINFNTLGTRRMQLQFVIDYSDDVDQARAILLRLAKADKRVLPEPAAEAAVTELGDRGVTITLKAWTAALQIGDTESALLQKAKEAFFAEGLTIPYPHEVGMTRDEFLAGKGKAKRP